MSSIPTSAAMVDIRLNRFAGRLSRAKGVNVLFLATPHEVSREWAPEAVAQGVHVIDLSGAWRLETPEYRAIYDFKDENPAAWPIKSWRRPCTASRSCIAAS